MSSKTDRGNDDLVELRDATLRLAGTMIEPTIRGRLLKIADELLELQPRGKHPAAGWQQDG